MIVLITHILYYYNYCRGIEPTFVRVFRVMSGSVSPSSVGLYGQSDIKRLIKYRLFFKIIPKHNQYFVTFLSFTFPFICFILNEQAIIGIIFGLPWSFINSLMCYYCGNCLAYKTLYLNIICTYLKLKIVYFNQQLISMKEHKSSLQTTQTLHSLDALHREINEYNITYWSKFLLIICLFFSIVVILAIFTILSLELIILKIMFIYATVFMALVFNLIVSKVCSLNYEANKSYKIFHSLIAEFSRMERPRRLPLVLTIEKVNKFAFVKFYLI